MMPVERRDSALAWPDFVRDAHERRQRRGDRHVSRSVPPCALQARARPIGDLRDLRAYVKPGKPSFSASIPGRSPLIASVDCVPAEHDIGRLRFDRRLRARRAVPHYQYRCRRARHRKIHHRIVGAHRQRLTNDLFVGRGRHRDGRSPWTRRSVSSLSCSAASSAYSSNGLRTVSDAGAGRDASSPDRCACRRSYRGRA